MQEKTEATHIVADKGHSMSWALPDGAISRFGQGPVMAMAVSPDGAYLAAATFWGHPTDVQDLAFSPDSTLLASGSFDGTILLWDLKSVMGS